MKYLIYGSGIGFGDMLVGMTAMKRYNNLGYRVILPVERQWVPAISECPFIHKIIPLEIRTRFTGSDMWDGGEPIEEYMEHAINQYIRNLDGEIFCARPFQFLPLWNSLVNKLEVKEVPPVKVDHDTIHCRPYTHQADSGLVPQYPCAPEVWFKKIPIIKMPSGFKVGICFGSPDATRRFSPNKMREILQLLNHNDITPVIIGGVKDEEHGLVGDGDWTYFDKKLSLPINHCLSLMSDLDVFISPDSGLIHACYPMKAHIITFQSRIFAEYVWHKRKDMDIIRAHDNVLYCSKKCSAKRMEALMTESELYQRTRNLTTGQVREIRHQLELPKKLDCFERFSTACLETINTYQIIDIVQKAKHKWKLAKQKTDES